VGGGGAKKKVAVLGTTRQERRLACLGWESRESGSGRVKCGPGKVFGPRKNVSGRRGTFPQKTAHRNGIKTVRGKPEGR